MSATVVLVAAVGLVLFLQVRGFDTGALLVGLLWVALFAPVISARNAAALGVQPRRFLLATLPPVAALCSREGLVEHARPRVRPWAFTFLAAAARRRSFCARMAASPFSTLAFRLNITGVPFGALPARPIGSVRSR